ncbi:hypothetical protein [Psychrobium sp. 1_MG-2023]|uniref:hypothetical protein n=1 Tax=Psychrobium sp. 1_MG-2023 TaxID=3062624 RepID=UPI000C32F646|nr:hypothetical protein [Psychrobium sp. 1_MG-2023]MDP2560838.1 hypothetical protein [Psychrobium sp. 1_MG-2023]PKF56712.1 hypothetical protein CW748_09545 [Alteromonadales bacterium alter-6D02]
MDSELKRQLIAQSWQMHQLVEQAYLDVSAKQGDELWQEKQRVLLADMALHLLQTALDPNEIALDKLRNNLYSIMTISDQFIPSAQLGSAKEAIYK